MKKTLLTCVLQLALPGAASAASEYPSDVRIVGLSYAGTGCPAASVYGHALVGSVWLGFDSYYPESGPGVPLSRTRKNCHLMIDLRYPVGWSFAIDKAALRSYADLARGSAFTTQFVQYYAGDARQRTFSGTLRGPYRNDFILPLPATAGSETPVWSPCGLFRMLNLNTQMRLTPATPSGTVRIPELFEGITKLELTLKWRRCV